MTTVNNISGLSTEGELIKAMKKRNGTRSTCDQLSELRQHTSSINSFDTSLYSLQPTNPVRTNLLVHKITMQPEIKREADEERANEEHNQERPQGQRQFDQTHFEIEQETQHPSGTEKTKKAKKKSNGTKQTETTKAQNNEEQNSEDDVPLKRLK